MSVQIIYKKILPKKDKPNLVLFVDERFNIKSLKNLISNHQFSFISDLLKTRDLKEKIINFDVNSKKKIILISIKKNINYSDVENLGANGRS